MAPLTYRLRFKGVILGNFTAAEIAEKLRANEISLMHAVEQRGRWLTVRQFQQDTAEAFLTPPNQGGLLGRLAGKSSPPPPPSGSPPPPPGSTLVADSIESRVRQGYLWSGLSFLLPVAIGLPIWLFRDPLHIPTTAFKILLVIGTLLGAAYSAWRTIQSAHSLQGEGLDDVGQSMQQLGIALAGASVCFWVFLVFINF
jgi:hypothetical protein